MAKSRGRYKTDQDPVSWIGEKQSWEDAADPQFTYKIADFYTKFKFKNIEAAIGDYVLISNADAAESDTVEGCDIGQITKLYESHDMDLEDRFRAHVQWFCRSSDVPLACFTSDIHLENFELVEDHRPFDSDVSIETFYKKCNVMKMPTTAIISEPKANKIPTFICRFRLIALSKKKLFLEPILEDERQHFDRINSLAMTPKTPKTRTKENLVMKTPDSLIKKFSRTSLNNDSWSIKKSNVSKLVFMRDITNSYDKSPSTKASLPRNVPKPASVTPIKIINRSVVTKKCSDNEIKNFLASDDDDSDTEMTPQSVKRTLNFEKHSLINNEVENTPNRTRSNRSVKSNSKYKDHVGVPTSPQVSKDFSTPKKSRKSHVTTPKRKSIKSESDSEDDFKPLKSKTLTPKVIKTPRKSIRRSEIIPCIKAREKPICIKENALEMAKISLHVSSVPLSLPCREVEFNNIYSFIEGKIVDNSGGCMYISGVPGTGKTATVTEVIRCLMKQVKLDEIPKFDYIEINGMRLTEPRQAYVHIYRQLTGKTVAWEQACSLLEARFTKPAPRRNTTVLLVDELDVLCNRRQDVLYNLLDWPSKAPAHLVVVAIANTMDLPERILMARVASRLGLTRLQFQPYNHNQLQSIVSARLADTDAFNSDAVQLVARKVAAVSGDARRALDICRRAVELAENTNPKKNTQVTLSHVNQALTEMIANPKVQVIKACSKMEQLFLQAIVAEVQRTGIEETTFYMVYKQFESICAIVGLKTPTVTETLGIGYRLGYSRIIIKENSSNDIYHKILLNVSSDDVHYATQALSLF